MPTTLQDVLELEGFKNAKVIAGHEGLKNAVKKATLMEVPDIFSFVEEHSLIITTLYPISTNLDKMKDFVPASCKLNVSGICIKTDRYIDEIPKFMIDQANDLNFPIIELRGNENLSDLVYEIINMSLDNHIETLEFRNLIHNHLMNFFLKGEDINVLIDEFSQLVKFPIILLDNDMKFITASKDLNQEGISVDILDNEFKSVDFNIKVNSSVYSSSNYIKHVIKAGKNHFGYLILLYKNNHDKNMLVAVEEASLLIASAFYKNFAVLEKEKNFQDSFIRDILSGVNYSQMEIVTKAKAYGWNLEFPQVMLVLRILDIDENNKKNAYESILTSGYFENLLRQQLSVEIKNTKITYMDESLVMFINVAFIKEVKQRVIELGYLIKEKFESKHNVGIGISNTILYANSFPSAYKEVQESILIGRYFNERSFVGHFDDYQIFSIIKLVEDRDLLYKYVDNKIGKIIEYDKDSNMNLMNTLLVLAKNGFNFKESAKALFIHYNTMRHRVDRLRELGINISNGVEISEMILAYNIYIWLEVSK